MAHAHKPSALATKSGSRDCKGISLAHLLETDRAAVAILELEQSIHILQNTSEALWWTAEPHSTTEVEVRQRIHPLVEQVKTAAITLRDSLNGATTLQASLDTLSVELDPFVNEFTKVVAFAHHHQTLDAFADTKSDDGKYPEDVWAKVIEILGDSPVASLAKIRHSLSTAMMPLEAAFFMFSFLLNETHYPVNIVECGSPQLAHTNGLIKKESIDTLNTLLAGVVPRHPWIASRFEWPGELRVEHLQSRWGSIRSGLVDPASRPPYLGISPKVDSQSIVITPLSSSTPRETEIVDDGAFRVLKCLLYAGEVPCPSCHLKSVLEKEASQYGSVDDVIQFLKRKLSAYGLAIEVSSNTTQLVRTAIAHAYEDQGLDAVLTVGTWSPPLSIKEIATIIGCGNRMRSVQPRLSKLNSKLVSTARSMHSFRIDGVLRPELLEILRRAENSGNQAVVEAISAVLKSPKHSTSPHNTSVAKDASNGTQ